MLNSLSKLSYFFALSLLVLLAFSHTLSNFWPAANSYCALIIISLHLALPIWAIERFNLSARDFNLYAYNLESIIDKYLFLRPSNTPDYKNFWRELRQSSVILIIIIIIYIIFYYYFLLYKTSNSNQELIFSLKFPSLWGSYILTQIFAVALPEEFFYRGFLQSSLQQKFSPLKAILITNIIFALGHFVGNFDPSRLLTFFPGLIFSVLVLRYSSLVSAIIFHAIFNLLGQVLALSFVTSLTY